MVRWVGAVVALCAVGAVNAVYGEETVDTLDDAGAVVDLRGN